MFFASRSFRTRALGCLPFALASFLRVEFRDGRESLETPYTSRRGRTRAPSQQTAIEAELIALYLIKPRIISLTRADLYSSFLPLQRQVRHPLSIFYNFSSPSRDRLLKEIAERGDPRPHLSLDNLSPSFFRRGFSPLQPPSPLPQTPFCRAKSANVRPIAGCPPSHRTCTLHLRVHFISLRSWNRQSLGHHPFHSSFHTSVTLPTNSQPGGTFLDFLCAYKSRLVSQQQRAREFASSNSAQSRLFASVTFTAGSKRANKTARVEWQWKN